MFYSEHEKNNNKILTPAQSTSFYPSTALHFIYRDFQSLRSQDVNEGTLKATWQLDPVNLRSCWNIFYDAKAANEETFLNECDNCATCVISAKNNVISSCCQKGRGGAGSGLQMTTRPLNPFCAKRFCPPLPSTPWDFDTLPCLWLCSTPAIAWHSFCSRICLRFQLALTRCEIPI